jgi:hypothetical protein
VKKNILLQRRVKTYLLQSSLHCTVSPATIFDPLYKYSILRLKQALVQVLPQMQLPTCSLYLCLR